MNCRAGYRWGLLMFGVLAFFLAALQPVLADVDIRVTISDPDHPGMKSGGYTTAVASDTPTVSAGENRVLGTITITGKPGVEAPVKVGDRIKISLSSGVAYMKVPTQDTYRQYVSWPRGVGQAANKICDGPGQPGMILECATPHSMILRVNHVDSSAPALLLRFNFEQEGYSCVRIAPFIVITDQWSADNVSKVSRLEFFKMFVPIAPNYYIGQKISNQTMEEKFSDISGLDPLDKEIIRPLSDSLLVHGYAGGLLKPQANITRNEAFALAGRSFGYMSTGGFRDGVAIWGDAAINYAARRILYWGYPDGMFRGQNELTRAEALELLENCFESRSMGDADRLQGQALGFI